LTDKVSGRSSQQKNNERFASQGSHETNLEIIGRTNSGIGDSQASITFQKKEDNEGI
jgi:hypothetical protein